MSKELKKFEDSEFTGKTKVIKELKDKIKELEIEGKDIYTELDRKRECEAEAKELRVTLNAMVESATKSRGKTQNRKSNNMLERAMQLTVGNRLK